MSVLPGLLPVTVLVLGTLFLGNARPAWRWDRAALRATIYFGAYAVLGAELLGLLGALTLAGVAVLWLVPLVVLAVLLGRSLRGSAILLSGLPRFSAPEALMAAILGIVLVTTAAVALLAPPNTWDSLTYHMARVAHWAQSGSLDHYATGIERQNLMSPGAEIAVLHAYVLGQGDRLANFPQWLAMAGSLVAVGAIARLLGATRIGQLASAVFVVTLPMGIAQATSTMTDYVVAIWVLCAAYETVALFRQPREDRLEIIPLAIAAGLAILAKPTAAAFLLPLALVVAWVVLRRRGLVTLLLSGLVACLLVLAVNAGYFGRNLATYGHPLGSRGKLETHTNEVMDARVVLSNLLRNASLHAGTPWEAVNSVIFRGIIWTHLKIGLDPTDPRTTVHEGFSVGPPVTDEKRAGNTVHAALLLVVFIVLAVGSLRGKHEDRLALGYLALAAGSFVLLSSMIKFSVFASRYHLPFFVLAAPAVGYVAAQVRRPWILAVLSIGLALTSFSSLLRLEQRPVLKDRRGYSVITSPRRALYFMTGHSLEDPYAEIVRQITASGCSTVGVVLGGDSAEYPFWALLGAPRPGLEVAWIVAGTPSARYEDPAFQPCAVICDYSCPDAWDTVRGLPLDFELSGFRVFQED